MVCSGEGERDQRNIRGDGRADQRVRAAQQAHRGLQQRHPQRGLRQRGGPGARAVQCEPLLPYIN